MIGVLTNGNDDGKGAIKVGLLLLASGPILNYLFERHNVLKLWENSPYPISWADLFYPPLCVLLSLSGTVLAVGGAIRRVSIRDLLRYVYAIAIPLTACYTLFAFSMQFVATGADRLGECPGLDQAAASSNVIPESQWRPGHPALGCGVQRRGVFLSQYNDVSVDGVTDSAAQQKVLEGIAEYFRQTHTHPVQVVFREMGTWSVRKLGNGATWGSGRPGRLIRIVNIG